MMKRRRLLITGVLLLLLGGAIVNVAVAWGFALREPYQEESLEDVYERASLIFADYGFSIPNDDIHYATCGSGTGLTLTSAIVDGEPNRIFILTETGWPTRGLSGVFLLSLPTDANPATSFHWAIEISPRFRAREPLMPVIAPILPLNPLWPGFAINTIFYAAIVWMVWFTPGMVRRRIRRRRGLCPACAYPIGTSEVCTECGKAIPGTGARSEGAKECRHG